MTRDSTMKKRRFNIIVQREEDWYVAVCLENDVASGKTIEESLDHLREALQLFYENEALSKARCAAY